ncbi:cytochrome c [Fulvivirgaceae bacterium BMA12]|uniref:Cytochrome c n=1 Tax=Agaribacillus aureus TaxID=3051825 RepID=A0ABT8L275_9BACT|nr:cytochrome c [Fulvivirgaceae bacterium BMA12]
MQRLFIYLALTTTIFSCRSKSEKESLAHGREIYIANCISCHGDTGSGVPDKYPSLVKTDRIIAAQTQRAVKLIKYGSGFENGMRPVALTDKEITEVINYIQNSWGNKADFIAQSQVKTIINQ